MSSSMSTYQGGGQRGFTVSELMSITIQLMTIQLKTTIVINSRSGLFLKIALHNKFCIITFILKNM